MNIRNIQRSEIEGARLFLSSNGWAHRVGNPAQFAALVLNSQRVAVAVADEQIVGFARAITDGISNGYLSMIAVSPEHRGQGVGRALVGHITRDNPGISWVLHADREGAEGFFESLGFRRAPNLMMRSRS
jgi:ribosomal protein S18 acetylase RimI-like enzyme